MLPQENARLVPEYVNIRHRVKQRGKTFVVDDLGRLDRRAFKKTLKEGGYEAAHFIDDTGDGCLTVTLRGLGRPTQSLPAYSLVTAPVFFPLADQLEISNWVRRSFINFQEHFAQGSPWPLCEGRRAANLELPRPDSLGDRAFERKDDTLIEGIRWCERIRSGVRLAGTANRDLSLKRSADAGSSMQPISGDPITYRTP
jgi:hypothetical protein